jgi:DNA invertase Pin-like site-specific DNA recombinase
MPNAYSYIRMSTDAQLQGDSYRRQAELSATYARDHGLTLMEGFKLEDIGVSAYRGDNLKHGALGKFVDAVKNKKIPKGSYLLIESLDRLSRASLNEALELFLGIINSGVNIVTVADGQRYTTGQANNTQQILMSIFIMARANEESDTKSRRLGEAWKQKRKKIASVKLTARCPAWLRLSKDKSKFEEIDDKVSAVKSIFAEAARGKGSYLITKHLNASKAPTLTGARIWSESYVTKILKNRAVLGEFQPHVIKKGKREPEGEIDYNYFPRIITEEQFLVVSHGRRTRAISSGGRRGGNQTNLFTHMTECRSCGSPFRYINKGIGEGQYLQCLASFNGEGCSSKMWRYSDFETTFLTFVRELDLRSVFTTTKDIEMEERLTVSLRINAERITNHEEAIGNLIRHVAEHTNQKALIYGEIERRQAEIEKHQSEIEAVEQQLKATKRSDISEEEIAAYIADVRKPGADRVSLSNKLRQIVSKIVIDTRQFQFILVQFQNGSEQFICPHPLNPSKIIFNETTNVGGDRRIDFFTGKTFHQRKGESLFRHGKYRIRPIHNRIVWRRLSR